jgi:hypothetical protein
MLNNSSESQIGCFGDWLVGRLTTLLCAVTGTMTIIDHFANTPFFSSWLSRHFASTPAGYQISPGLNFLVIVGLGGGIWLITGSDNPHPDAAAAKKLWRLRANLAAAAMAAWLLLGPSIRRGPAVVPAAAPGLSIAAPLGQAPPSAPPFGEGR